MNHNIIQTGSSGNCVILDDCIMLDISVSFKKIADYAKQIKIVLISHRHQDHVKASTVKKLLSENGGVFIFCPEDTMDFLKEKGVESDRIFTVNIRQMIDWATSTKRRN